MTALLRKVFGKPKKKESEFAAHWQQENTANKLKIITRARKKKNAPKSDN